MAQNGGEQTWSGSPDFFSWYADRFNFPLDRARDLQEIGQDQVIETDYPKSLGVPYYLEFSGPGQFSERSYAVVLHSLRDRGYGSIIKLVDTSALSEGSMAFRNASFQQASTEDRVLRQLGHVQEAVGVLFKLVQELQALDVRLRCFADSESDSAVGAQEDLTLKTNWLDEVNGGPRNPGSLFSWAQRLRVPELEALFYSLRRLPLGPSADVLTPEQIKDLQAELAGRVRALALIDQADAVLQQTLLRYYAWKDSERRDLQTRRQFALHKLRTHYGILRLELTQVRPYLCALRRQTAATNGTEKVQLLSAFDSILTDVELLAKKKLQADRYAVLLITLQFTTRPPPARPSGEKIFSPSSVVVQYRAYCWDDEEIGRYLAYRQGEGLDLLAEVSGELSQQLSAVEKDLTAYLREAGVLAAQQVSDSVHPPSWIEQAKGSVRGIFEPLNDGIAGFQILLHALSFGTKESDRHVVDENLVRAIRKDAYACYKIFKQAHGMVTW